MVGDGKINFQYRWLSAALLLMACGGCIATPTVPAKPLPAGSTYLIHLPGIAGDSIFDRWWMNALQEQGAADRAELYDWTCNDPWLGALHAYHRNHREARKIAQWIAARLRSDPHAKVILTAESGGTALAVWALEDLPPALKVESVVLVAPAISPGYDLTAALRHVRAKAFYFTSPGDWFMLGWGTRTFGTMDGKHTDGAGHVGFHPPPSASPIEYRKLIRERYNPSWWRWGNFGSHGGGMSSAFARHVIAPLLRPR